MVAQKFHRQHILHRQLVFSFYGQTGSFLCIITDAGGTIEAIFDPGSSKSKENKQIYASKSRNASDHARIIPITKDQKPWTQAALKFLSVTVIFLSFDPKFTKSLINSSTS